MNNKINPLSFSKDDKLNVRVYHKIKKGTGYDEHIIKYSNIIHDINGFKHYNPIYSKNNTAIQYIHYSYHTYLDNLDKHYKNDNKKLHLFEYKKYNRNDICQFVDTIIQYISQFHDSYSYVNINFTGTDDPLKFTNETQEQMIDSIINNIHSRINESLFSYSFVINYDLTKVNYLPEEITYE
jgi:hypothetical protein